MKTRKKNVARQLDYCDVCGDHIHKKDLVRMQMRYLRPVGQNRFPYDKYNSTHWTCTGVDQSTISMGPWEARCRVNDDNTVDEIDGWQTWEGDGDFYTAAATDISSWTKLTVSANVGPYHGNTSPTMTVKMGCCNSDCSTKYLQRTWTIKNDQRCWFTATVADLVADGVTSSAAYFYIEIVNDGYWYIANLHLENGVEKPSDFVPNITGAAVNYTTSAREMVVLKTCHKHKERIQRDSQIIGRPRTDTEPPITVVIQEN